jgi:tRNA-dihydrouridine synthase B
MAGFTTWAQREIVRSLGGCGLLYSELVSAIGFTEMGKRGKGPPERLFGVKEEKLPKAVQIWDKNPAALVEIARRLREEYAVSVIDLNFGCPARKIMAVGSGSYLLDNPLQIGRLVEAVVKACEPTPITVKMRLGVSKERPMAAVVAKIVEESGASALTVHGRYAEQMYSGIADWDRIAELKGFLRHIPLIGNGDVKSPEQACAGLKRYGVDGVMIGRQAVAEPWIFREAQALLRGEAKPAPPTIDEQRDLLLKLHELTLRQYDESFAHVFLRGLVSRFAPGRRGARLFRRDVCCCRNGQEFREVVFRHFSTPDETRPS